MNFSNNDNKDDTKPWEEAFKYEVEADDELKDVEDYVEEYD